jgi:hypothetical protein
MKKKYILAAFALGLSISCKVMAQVPNYVPTNGLVGWWPFNGNANDEGGTGNNGTVNGATSTTDRFGEQNKAYLFNGSESIILTNLPIQSNWSISGWIKSPLTNNFGYQYFYGLGSQSFSTYGIPGFGLTGLNQESPCTNLQSEKLVITDATTNCLASNFLANYTQNTWYHIVLKGQGSNFSVYMNEVLVWTGNLNPINLNELIIGTRIFGFLGFKGKIDDIGIWSRSLTDQEISLLYNGCENEITAQPENANIIAGSNAQFTVGVVAGSTYQWQNNPLNNGWQNVNNNTTYSGATTNTLTVSNTSVSNHNQPFRAIVNAGGCIDTSIVAQIIIGDTCLTTVTDTLIINTTLGLPAPNNENTILIYPNPANDHITIDNGNYTAMSGYSIKIENNAGQQVFQSLINQAQFYVDLSTWSGNGLYFVHLIDAQGNTVTVRKIVLQ